MSSKPQLFPWPHGRRAAVSLTWDDARFSQADTGLPILDGYGIKGTFYVLPDRVLPRLDRWRQAIKDGHEIGNHTVRHPCSGNFAWQSSETMLEAYTLDRMEAELLEANRLLNESLGIKPTSFAYCCGMTFVGRGTQVRSYVPLIAKHFLAGRCYLNEVHNDPARCDLAQVLGFSMDDRPFKVIRRQIEEAVAAGGWATFVGHEVGQDGQPLNAPSGVLRQICDYLTGRPEIWVDTISSIGRHVAAIQAGEAAAHV